MHGADLSRHRQPAIAACQEFPRGFTMNLIETLKHAGRFSVRPVYSVMVHKGGWFTQYHGDDPGLAAGCYERSVWTYNFVDVRCDGVSVDLSKVEWWKK